jgi:hypothetical protein
MYSILSNIVLFFLFVSSSNSIKEETKFCINCKYFVNQRSNPRFGKCSFFTIQDSRFLVDGKNTKYYNYATIARESESLCGIEGKHYEKKGIPDKKENDSDE